MTELLITGSDVANYAIITGISIITFAAVVAVTAIVGSLAPRSVNPADLRYGEAEIYDRAMAEREAKAEEPQLSYTAQNYIAEEHRRLNSELRGLKQGERAETRGATGEALERVKQSYRLERKWAQERSQRKVEAIKNADKCANMTKGQS